MNCPLCRQPIQCASTSGRTSTCFSGHVVNTKSLLPGVLPIIPGWLCWQTESNSGISEMRYAFWGENLAGYEDDDSFGQELIDRYEDWINHASHGARITWGLNCAVPEQRLREELLSMELRAMNAQAAREKIAAQIAQHYPEQPA